MFYLMKQSTHFIYNYMAKDHSDGSSAKATIPTAIYGQSENCYDLPILEGHNVYTEITMVIT